MAQHWAARSHNTLREARRRGGRPSPVLSCPLPPSLPTPFRAQLPPSTFAPYPLPGSAAPSRRSLPTVYPSLPFPVPSGRWAAAHLDAQPAPLRHHAFRQHLGPCHAASRHDMGDPTCDDRSVPDRTRPVHHTHTAAAASRAPRDQSPSAVHAPLPTRERFALSSTRRGGGANLAGFACLGTAVLPRQPPASAHSLAFIDRCGAASARLLLC